MLSKLKRLIYSKTIRYALVSYISIGLGFINNILLAEKLSINNYGIYSFIALLLQYLSYADLGIHFSFINMISIKCNNNKLVKLITQNVFTINLILSIVICIGFIIISNANIGIFRKYSIGDFKIQIILLAVIMNTNVLFTKLYRLYLDYYKLMAQLLVPPLILFIYLIFFSTFIELKNLVIVMLFSRIFVFIVFLFKLPVKIKLHTNFRIVKIILYRGINLLIYNVSIAYLPLSTLTIVSYYCSVEQFSQFRLAYSLSTASLLLVSAIETLFYPKLFHKLSSYKTYKSSSFINEISSIYSSISQLLNFTIIASIPIIKLVFPKYLQMLDALKIFLIANIVLSTGYTNKLLLVSQGKEKVLIVNAILSIIVIVLTSTFLFFVNMPYTYLSFSYLIGVIFFNLFTVNKISSIFSYQSIKYYLLKYCNYKSTIPIIFIFISVILSENVFLPLLSFIIFIMINYGNIKYTVLKVFAIIKDDKALGL